MWYVTREMGFVNKMMRGLARPDASPDEMFGGTIEKPWVAGVEHFAIGGGCQYLLTMDYVVAASDAYMTLPARKEGIIPGAANMRMWRFTGDRIARQAIMFGRRLDCDTPEGRMICDEIVPPGEMDAALDARDRELHRFGRGQRGRQPARIPRRRGAARQVPPLHGGLCARAGLLPFQPGADRQSREALERAAEEDVEHARSKRAADFAPRHEDLNPIEIASRDEIAALQLRRMKWSLKHAYENVRALQEDHSTRPACIRTI